MLLNPGGLSCPNPVRCHQTPAPRHNCSHWTGGRDPTEGESLILEVLELKDPGEWVSRHRPHII